MFKALSGETVFVKDRPFFLTETGRQGFYEGQYTPLRDESGEILGGLAIIRATTKRKQIEAAQARLWQAMERSAMEWRRTFDAVESAMLIVDMDGKITRVNRATKRLLGKSYQRITRGPVEGVGSVQPWQTAAELVSLVRENGSSRSCQARDESTGRTWDIAASVSAAPGEDQRIILVAREITKLVELQAALRRSEVMSAMGSLVAGVAHGVRNPLFGISATVDAFEARFPDREEYQQYTRVLRRELDRLSQLMQELLEYGRPQSREVSEGSIGDVIDQTIQLCAAQTERMKVNVANDVEKGFAPGMMDGTRLLLAFQNVLENAIEHSPQGGIIRVAAKEIRENGHRWAHCTIQDSGPGFRKDDLPRVFEPFFTRRRNGTGLGLSIAQRIIEDHRGWISADNRPEGGAVISVTCPLYSG